MASVEKVKFKDIDINDVFFDSLKEDYLEFEAWFKRKENEEVYILKDDLNKIQAFLYMKIENEIDTHINPIIKDTHILKVGTFKINAHGTKLGERFIKLIFDKMIQEKIRKSYVTIYKKQQSLIELLKMYGFFYWGTKGDESVYIKDFDTIVGDIQKDYPLINLKNNKKIILSIYPTFHTSLFPDSKLNTERDHVIEDLSHTNCIEKIYLSGANNMTDYKKGDIIAIYRTAEHGKIAEYSSVVTSICTIKDIIDIRKFKNLNDFLEFCGDRTIFKKSDLTTFWNTKRYPYLIVMLYNIALNKRIIRKELIENIGISRMARIVAYEITTNQIEKILDLGRNDKDFILI